MILVFGSINIDLLMSVSSLPVAGETVLTHEFQQSPGGKGANQAIMAGLLGAETTMITCLGSDIFAESTIENFKSNSKN